MIFHENQLPALCSLLLTLTIKATITTAADDKFCDIFPSFRQKVRYEI